MPLRRALAALALLLAPLAAAAGGPERQPVVVELYTSQGCSACPPADAFLRDLAARPDVIALALHVDYWDYLGWRDVFARPLFTSRQHAYREAAGERSVYTPEIVVQGVSHHPGSRREEVLAAVAAARAAPAPAKVEIAPRGDLLEVRIAPLMGPAPEAVVWAVPYRHAPAKVLIEAGENSGRKAVHVNVARDWLHLGDWDGRSTVRLMITAPEPGDGVAVILQRGRIGAVLGAAKYEN